MPKNPFVDCKSRKRRKTKVANTDPIEKKFCPPTMVRYDNCVAYSSTNWVCKMCLKVLLSEEAVGNHLKVCNLKTGNRAVPVPPVPVTSINTEENTGYVCKVCSIVFSRLVSLKKHMERHENQPSSTDSE